jgi:hypothetical protein
VEHFEGKQICIIENPSVKSGFLESYKRALTNKGYIVKQFPPSASLVQCPISSTYSAYWRWDLALYLAYMQIKVYKNGEVIGEVFYNSERGGPNFRKFVDANAKITELVNQLFPGGAGME